MITVNGVSVPKREIYWTDAKEQAWVGNARAINAIFNDVDLNVFKLINSCTTAKEAWKILEVAYEGTSKEKISRLQLITSKFEALKMTEDEIVSEYNERVLKIANNSLLLGEKIPEFKIVRKVLRSLPRKFDMKVTAKEEAQNITTLKLDELFGSLLTFEMTSSDRESKKAPLTKQFSKMARNFKRLNTTGKTEKTERHDDENSIRKVNDSSYRRNSDHGKKNEDVGRSFRCRECDGFGHYQVDCPTYLKRQKKNYCSTLSDEDSDDDEDDHGINAFTACITKINSEADSECFDIDEDEELTLEELIILRKEYSEARAIQKERIQDLMDENERLMGIISSLKLRLNPEFGAKWFKGTHWIWMVKTSEKCNVAFTTVQTHVDAWYFDSGYSRHMTSNRSFFTELEECASGHVTFGDGAKGKIIDKITDKNNQVFMSDRREADNCYHWSSNDSNICHLSKVDQTWLWHRKLGHISLRSLDKVMRNKAVVGIPLLDINDKFFCVGGGGEKYVLVVVDDYSRFTWVRFLKGKLDTGKLCINLCLNLQREKSQKIIRIRCNHGNEFENEDLNNFCQTEGIHHEFAAPITPQQNGVVERKNRTLQEMARVMIHAKNLPLNFWAEAVNTACHIHDRVTTRSGTTVTLYELWKGRKPNIKYFHIFGSICYILADRKYHRKWDVKSDQEIFLGYSQNSRAYRVFNIKSGTVMETINVVVNDFESNINQFNIENDETHVTPEVTSTPLDEMSKGESQLDSAKTYSSITDEVINNETVLVPSAHVKKNHPLSSLIGDPSAGITTRRKEKVDYTKMIADLCYVSAIEPTSVENALKDEYWINAMQKELL
ncbi:gag-pol polyprotein [Cucumis melo var. makuwa]|uniref:Gag-pol polyprotein n=1 Tax=Cucumis melo var. makuwa TaxID=1194695 RepID=A0A5A7V0X1_CUCMM|nr:gag-pol polyprotein [Cucumis melo var. makuwa]